MTEKRPPGIDVDSVLGVDVHVHVHASVHGDRPESIDDMVRYFRAEDVQPRTLPDIAAYYRERQLACVAFTVDAVRSPTPGRPSNAEIVDLAQEFTDTVIPFVSIDPARGKEGVDEARRLIDAGAKGFKFHPSVQGFFPNDPIAHGLYEVIQDAGLIATFHSGHTGAGAGTRGGRGVRLKYSNPMLIDDVAADFPDLKIILAHPSFPWQDEAISVALHKPLVHIDLSGWSPKYFPPQLVQYANTLLKDKILFGTDFPLITPQRWLADFDALPIRDEVRPMILKENASRLFGLRSPVDLVDA